MELGWSRRACRTSPRSKTYGEWATGGDTTEYLAARVKRTASGRGNPKDKWLLTCRWWTQGERGPYFWGPVTSACANRPARKQRPQPRAGGVAVLCGGRVPARFRDERGRVALIIPDSLARN